LEVLQESFDKYVKMSGIQPLDERGGAGDKGPEK
jgi:hypothetical protein